MPDVPRELAANLRWRRKALWDGAHVPGAAKALREACAKDILFWVNTFAWTYDPRKIERPEIPFVTWPFQDLALTKLLAGVVEGHDVGVEKSRDMGASWINMALLTWLMQFWPTRISALAVSRNEDYVDAPGDPKSLFWKADFLLKRQPRWLRPRTMRRTSMHIENGETGSVIDGESTTGEVGRGDRRAVILMDEYAAFEVAAGYAAAASTRDVTNCRIFNSTPRGTGNAFYELMHRDTTDVVRMHWSQHPEKNRGLYVCTAEGKVELKDGWRGEVWVRVAGGGRRKVRFPDEYPFVPDGKLRSPWYDTQFNRATSPQEIAQELDIDYIGSDYQFFNAPEVAKYRAKWCQEPQAFGELDYDLTSGQPRKFVPNGKGTLALWRAPGRDGRWPEDLRFCIGADVSAGTGASNSTAAVYEMATHEKWAELADPHLEPRDFALCVLALARWFNGATVNPDRSGPTGEQFVKRYTQEPDAPPLYRRYRDKKISKERVDEYGMFLNPQAKTSLLIEYRAAIGDETVVNRSDRAMAECLQFVRRMDGAIEHSAALNSQDPSGARAAHGDIVVADALAVLVLNEDEGEVRRDPPPPPEDSVAGRMAARRRAEAKSFHELTGGGW